MQQTIKFKLAFLRANGVHRLHLLKTAKEVDQLYTHVLKTGMIPPEFGTMTRIGSKCRSEMTCYSKRCFSGVCASRRPMKMTTRSKACYSMKGVKLRPHQKRVVEQMNRLDQRNSPNMKGLMLVHSTGTGKTLTAAGVIKCFLKEHPRLKAVVITPTAVRSQFEKVLADAGIDMTRVLVSSHQKFLMAPDPSFLGGLLVVDEAHEFRTLVKRSMSGKIQGIASWMLLKLASKMRRVLLMTATPYTNSLSDLFNALLVLSGAPISKNPDGLYKNLRKMSFDDILTRLRCLVSVYSGVKEGFPDVKESVVELPMSDRYYKYYRDVEQATFAKLGLTFQRMSEKSVNAFYIGVRKASNMHDSKVEQLDNAKVEYVVGGILSNVNRGRKCLVYSNFKGSGFYQIANLLNALGVAWAAVDGTMTEKERKSAVFDYNRKRVKVLLITGAGSEGLDLKETEAVYLLEPSWNRARIDQVIGRASRFKSHDNLPKERQVVNVYHMVLRFSDKQINERKKSVNVKVLDSVDTKMWNSFVLPKSARWKDGREAMRKVAIEASRCKS